MGICVVRATPSAYSTASSPPRICEVIESNARGFFYSFILSKNLWWSRETPRASSTASSPLGICVMRATPRDSSAAIFPPRIWMVIESNTESFFYNFILSYNLCGDREQRPGLLLQLHPLQEFVWWSRATPRVFLQLHPLGEGMARGGGWSATWSPVPPIGDVAQVSLGWSHREDGGNQLPLHSDMSHNTFFLCCSFCLEFPGFWN